jgi:hypothetical protein
MLGNTLKTWEPFDNMMRTCWGNIGNKEEKQKITPPTPPHPEKEKRGPIIMSVC